MKGTKDLKTNKGITLIALVITIIVMLILVAVTITMAVNGGLFEYAGRAGTQTNEKRDAEQEYANLQPGMTYDEIIEKYTNDTEGDSQAETEKITFSINGTNYTVPKGTTWVDFEEVGRYGFESHGDYVSKGDNYVHHEDGTNVLWASELINGHAYEVEEGSSTCGKCNDGFIEGYKCSECGIISLSYSEDLYRVDMNTMEEFYYFRYMSCDHTTYSRPIKEIYECPCTVNVP